jgi:hypothetical protein
MAHRGRAAEAREAIRLEWLPTTAVAAGRDVKRAIKRFAEHYPKLAKMLGDEMETYMFRRSFASTVAVLERFADPVPKEQATRWTDLLFELEELCTANVNDGAVLAACLHLGFDICKEYGGPFERGGVCLRLDQAACDDARQGFAELVDLQLLGDMRRADCEYTRVYSVEAEQ